MEDYRNLRRRMISEKSATIQLDAPESIYSYKVPLTQIIYNLLDNALKYAREDIAPEVKVTITAHDQRWRISIQDNGIGIDEEQFENIFVLFQRLHTVDEYSGTGVGLAIVKKTIENLGGSITVTSQPEKGSTFTVELPILTP